MNSQSAGAVLILAGLGMLWLLWSNRSPFGRYFAPADEAKIASQTAAAAAAAGAASGFWGSVPGLGAAVNAAGGP